MAKNLFKLSHYLDSSHFGKTAMTMLTNVKPEMQDHPSANSNWYDLMLNYTSPFYEVAVSGKDAIQKIKALSQSFIPNKLIAGSTAENYLPLLENRFNSNETLINVCINMACKLPVSEIKDAINLLKK